MRPSLSKHQRSTRCQQMSRGLFLAASQST
ncbi:hypothetical protein CGRA01v4_06629 [Colletotrichum graminicola]|nr:hypothetical protein CGRA01v4_06629 [Colletotrichum graminicola]